MIRTSLRVRARHDRSSRVLRCSALAIAFVAVVAAAAQSINDRIFGGVIARYDHGTPV
jgi:hypothetical protein